MSIFPNLWLAPLAPLLASQGKRVRKNIPQLPEAAGASEGFLPGEEQPYTILAVGESPIAGVGVERMEDSLTGQLAREVNRSTGRAVSWRAFGKTGATVDDNEIAIQQVDSEKESLLNADMLLICLGISDSIALTTPRYFSRKMDCLILRLRMRLWPLPVLLTGVPQPDRFAARLPNPLRWVLARRADSLDKAMMMLAKQSYNVKHCPSNLPEDASVNPATINAFARDGFHPGLEGYRLWARELLPHTLELLDISTRRGSDHRGRSALEI